MRKIFVAIPCYSGQITVPTFLSIVQSIEEARKKDWTLDLHCLSGDADLARCRNVLLGEFIQSDASDLLFIDADISWDVSAFTRLMRHNVDFVCGVYRMRTDDKEVYPVHWPQQKRLRIDEATKLPLLAADMVPGGFWRLSRACVEQMAKGRPWITDKLFPDVRYPWIFDFEFDGMVRRSEDYTFCRKWQALGGTVWVDPAINLGHTGMKTFEGNLVRQLARETAAFRKQEAPQLPGQFDPAGMARMTLASL